ncbi:neprilysin-1-like [Dermacentor albipictus]|uniref:neprilysin-1-like n=1 Tax=Dermacentor albipictus TaxID=60249 RepID=UPI0031FC6C05
MADNGDHGGPNKTEDKESPLRFLAPAMKPEKQGKAALPNLAEGTPALEPPRQSSDIPTIENSAPAPLPPTEGDRPSMNAGQDKPALRQLLPVQKRDDKSLAASATPKDTAPAAAAPPAPDEKATTKKKEEGSPRPSKSEKGAQGSVKGDKGMQGSTKSSSVKENQAMAKQDKDWMEETFGGVSFPDPEPEPQAAPPPGLTPDEWNLLAIVLAVFVLLVLVLLVIVMVLEGSWARTGACHSEHCKHVAKLLLDSVSPDVNPCDNFYQRVCGRWKYAGSQGDVLFDKLIGDVTDLVRTMDVPPTGQSPAQKAALAYRTCEDIVAKNNTNLTTLVQILEEAGLYAPPGWKGPVDALNATFFLHFKWRIAAPLKFTYVRPAHRGITLRMAPSESLKAYARRRLEPGFYDALRNDYEVFHTTFEPNKLPNVTYDDWKKMDENVVTDSMSILNTLDSTNDFAGWNENSIQDAIRGVSQRQWTSILDMYFNRSNSLRFYVDSVFLFKKFMQLPNQFGAMEAQGYFRWYMVEILTRRVYAPWIIREFPTYQDAMKYQHRFCYAILKQTASYAFLAPYVSKVFTADVKHDIRQLLQTVRESYNHLFAKGDQLRSNVKRLRSYANDTGHVFDLLSLSQERSLEENYATYEDMTSDPLLNWKRLMVGRSTSLWNHVSMETAGVLPSDLLYYRIDGVSNDIILRPDVAVLPAYDSRAPLLLKLASLGSLMASAMAKVLCVTLENTARWRKAADCIFSLREPSNDTESGGKMVILQRVIALAVTVSAAMTATKGDKPLTIPGVPDLSGMQLLYVVWCYQQCGEREGGRLCNEPLKEIGVFADAFRCGANATMKRANTCTAKWFNTQLQSTTMPEDSAQSENVTQLGNTTQARNTLP